MSEHERLDHLLNAFTIDEVIDWSVKWKGCTGVTAIELDRIHEVLAANNATLDQTKSIFDQFVDWRFDLLQEAALDAFCYGTPVAMRYFAKRAGISGVLDSWMAKAKIEDFLKASDRAYRI